MPDLEEGHSSSDPESMATTPEKSIRVDWAERGARARASLIAALKSRVERPHPDERAEPVDTSEGSDDSEIASDGPVCYACGKPLEGIRAMEVLPCKVGVVDGH